MREYFCTCFHLDFLSGVFPSEKDAATEFMRRRAAFSDEPPTVLLNGIVSSRLAYGILKQAAIPMRGETAGELSEQDIHRITACGYAYTVKVNNTRGFDYAQVTAGGADCGEFDPATMGSLFAPGLFACGEVLNVDGNCGGFNLMFAFSSGLLAGRSASLFADSLLTFPWNHASPRRGRPRRKPPSGGCSPCSATPRSRP